MNSLSQPVTVNIFICPILIPYFLALWTDFFKDQMGKSYGLEKLYGLLFLLLYPSLSFQAEKATGWTNLTSVKKKQLIILLISLSLSHDAEVIFRIFHDTPYFYPFLHSKVNRNPLFCKDFILIFPTSVPHPVESFLFTLFSCLSN